MAIGRPSDPTQSFFLMVDSSKVRCIDCKSLVRNKIERLRKHRTRCRSICSTIQQESDLIVEPSPQPSPIKRPKTCQPHMSSFTVKTDSAAASATAANQLHLQIANFFMLAISRSMLPNIKNSNP